MKHSSFPRTLLHNICRASLLLLLAAACSNENPADEPNPDDKRVTVEFLVPGITSMGTPTRGESALPEGATVRIIVYNSGESPNLDLLKGSQTYYVKGGRLVPCTVDDNGKFIAEDPNGKISLEPRDYAFCVCTPALKIIPDSDGGNYASIVVPQNLDYAGSITDNKLIAFTGVVALDALEHKCARLQLKVNSDDAAITAMTVKNATLTGFSDDKKETYLGHPLYGSPIAGGTKSATTTAFTQAATNPKLSNADLFLLPCVVTTPVKVTYEIAYTVLGIERTETVSADLPSLTLVEGKSYTLTANFAKDGGIHLSISDWEQSEQDNSMGEGTYPRTCGSAIISKDLYGSSGAIFHPNWTTTPDHNETSGYFYSVAPRFEVAASDAGSISGTNANTTCTSPWRLPTMGELRLIYGLRGQLSGISTAFVDYGYWTAAKTTDGGSAWYKNLTGGKEATTSIGYNAYIRCIKDLASYPYVAKNAEGKLSVIVSKDLYGSSGVAMHPNWTATPDHDNTNEYYASVSARFEVAANDIADAIAPWVTTNEGCSAGWRRPTMGELRLIFDMKGQLAGINRSFKDYGYWTAASTTDGGSAWYKNLVNGKESTTFKNYSAHTRCVRDL